MARCVVAVVVLGWLLATGVLADAPHPNVAGGVYDKGERGEGVGDHHQESGGNIHLSQAHHGEMYTRQPASDAVQRDRQAREAFLIERLELSPSLIRLRPPSGGTVMVTLELVVEAGLQDDPSSLYPPQVMLVSPSGVPLPGFITPASRIAGDSHHGTYQLEVPIPLWNMGDGDYMLEFIYVVDDLGRDGYFMQQDLEAFGFSARVAVTGGKTDPTSPMLLDLRAQQLTPCERAEEVRRDDLVQPAACPVTVSLIVKESGGSGINAETHGGVYPLSRITLTSTRAPAVQSITEYILPSHVDKTATDRLARADTVVLSVTVHMPFWVWPGGWEVSEVLLVDGAGNTNLWGRYQLQRQRPFVVTFRIQNANLTYMGEDLFDYLDDSIVFPYQEYEYDEYW